jgi:DNA-binding response OmpR family regulator
MKLSTPPIRLLLVEDDIDDYMFFRDALSETGLNVDLKIATRCTNILEVIGKDKERLPQIIFLDLHMPMVSGNECLKTIRDNSYLDHVPVIIYSTSASSFDIEDTFAGGANLYFTKPSSFQLLVTALRNILQMNWKDLEKEKSRTNFVYKHTSLDQAA